jgi:type II secretion system protein G
LIKFWRFAAKSNDRKSLKEVVLMLKARKSQAGFTLIEMMVVVAIIGMLAAMAMPRFSSGQQAARTARVQADLRTIEAAIIMYEVDQGEFPDEIADLLAAPEADDTSGRGGPYLRSTPVSPSGAVRVTPQEGTPAIVEDGVYSINGGRAVFGKDGGPWYTVEQVK